MELGIFARTFPRPTLEATLDAVVESGLRTMQFNPALAGGASPAGIREATDARGLRMAAVSGTYNMAHPDPSVRADGAERLAAVIATAHDLGTSIVTLCTGTRDTTDMWRRHRDNGTPAAWRDLLSSVAGALAVAEAHGVTLAFEPEQANVVDSPAAGRRLLDELRSPHLKVVIDPVNLAPGAVPEAFELLGDDLALAHAKRLQEVDYRRYLDLLRQAGDAIPLILHGLAEEEVRDGIAFLRRALSATAT
jgi:sugar phosphate isomerase/epimerase